MVLFMTIAAALCFGCYFDSGLVFAGVFCALASIQFGLMNLAECLGGEWEDQ